VTSDVPNRNEDQAAQATCSDEFLATLERDVFANYEGRPGDLIPILQDIQEIHGYLPEELLVATARRLKMPTSSVYGVATFYTHFYLTPQGRNRIKVCQGTACHVRGVERLVDAIRGRLGIGPGETSEDFEFSVEGVACFGSCALAPVVVLNGKVHGNMTPDKVHELLDGMA
jgi:NADH-quinone oxidoreductase subunit E